MLLTSLLMMSLLLLQMGMARRGDVVGVVVEDVVVAVTDGEGEAWRSVQDVNQGGWSVLMCLNTSARSDACVVSATDSLRTRPHQKVFVLLWLCSSSMYCAVVAILYFSCAAVAVFFL